MIKNQIFIKITLIFVMLISTKTYADNGLYFGAGAGIDFGYVELGPFSFNTSEISPCPIPDQWIHAKLKVGSDGASGSGFVGYEWLTKNNFYFAFETEASYSHINPRIGFLIKGDILPITPSPYIDAEVSAKMLYTLEGGFIIGYKLKNNVLFRLRGSAVTDKAKLMAHFDATGISKQCYTRNKYSYGGAIAIGMDTYITEHLTLGFEDSINYYPFAKFSLRVVDHGILTKELRFRGKVAFLLNEFNLRLTYHFGSSESYSFLPNLYDSDGQDDSYNL